MGKIPGEHGHINEKTESVRDLVRKWRGRKE
jgi:hypothetical protein